MILDISLELTFVSKGDDQADDLTVLEGEEGVQIQRWKMIITFSGRLVIYCSILWM